MLKPLDRAAEACGDGGAREAAAGRVPLGLPADGFGGVPLLTRPGRSVTARRLYPGAAAWSCTGVYGSSPPDGHVEAAALPARHPRPERRILA
ncbi:hypothetical protein GCM10010521_68390 [Streptomyces rameus]|uniref:Uncharacterized protein n=1 Tax=Streptomyces rameus TaxID=68261 RepID=A0ABP6HL96_9ACTN